MRRRKAQCEAGMPHMGEVIGSHDLIFITLDTLRYDIAQREFLAGRLPLLGRFLGTDGWQLRHSPASFTWAAHHAFFAGFLPTPATPGPHARLFASEFGGSETICPQTFVFQEAYLPQALAARGYHTLCLGGVGFFNRRGALGSVLPDLFQESHWHPGMGVMHPQSCENQVAWLLQRLPQITQPLFLFLNVAAIHKPNHFYLPDCKDDNLESHAAALRVVDAALQPLFAYLEQRGPAFCIICSDHGSAYGEQGFHGHRLAQQSVWEVPYTHFFLSPRAPECST